MLASFKPLPSSYKKNLGSEGESLVQNYLCKQGFVILATNFFIRGGEIDIIASKGDLIIFVEVKTRRNIYFNVSEVITLSKQKKIIFASKAFILKKSYENVSYRFDVAIVDGKNNITYIENAFCQNEY